MLALLPRVEASMYVGFAAMLARDMRNEYNLTGLRAALGMHLKNKIASL